MKTLVLGGTGLIGRPVCFVPFWGRDFSRPDPTMTLERFGLHLTDDDVWLPSVVRAHLGDAPSTRPPRSHEGYEHRAAERSLASQITSVRPRS